MKVYKHLSIQISISFVYLNVNFKCDKIFSYKVLQYNYVSEKQVHIDGRQIDSAVFPFSVPSSLPSILTPNKSIQLKSIQLMSVLFNFLYYNIVSNHSKFTEINLDQTLKCLHFL